MDFTLYLVRHGEYDNPDHIYPFLLPVTLSYEGREHIQRAAIWFARNSVKGTPIVTSPVVRTVQTAEIIASALNSMVSVDTRLTETQHSELQGTVMPENDPFGDYYERAPKESQEDMLKRMVEIAEERIALAQDCIMVSHGDPLSLLYCHLAHKPIPQRVRLSEDNIQKGEIVVAHFVEGAIHTVKRIKV